MYTAFHCQSKNQQHQFNSTVDAVVSINPFQVRFDRCFSGTQVTRDLLRLPSVKHSFNDLFMPWGKCHLFGDKLPDILRHREDGPINCAILRRLLKRHGLELCKKGRWTNGSPETPSRGRADVPWPTPRSGRGFGYCSARELLVLSGAVLDAHASVKLS